MSRPRSVIGALRETRRILARPRGWARGTAQTRTTRGRDLETGETYPGYCLTGAVEAALGLRSGDDADVRYSRFDADSPVLKLLDQTLAALAHEVDYKRQVPGDSTAAFLQSFNDFRTRDKRDVLRVIDKAITRRSKK